MSGRWPNVRTRRGSRVCAVCSALGSLTSSGSRTRCVMSNEPCNSYSTLYICFNVDCSTFSKPEIPIRLSTIASQFVESKGCSQLTHYHFTQSILGDTKERSRHRSFRLGVKSMYPHMWAHYTPHLHLHENRYSIHVFTEIFYAVSDTYRRHPRSSLRSQHARWRYRADHP